MKHEALAMEMRGLREQVTGITDTAVATTDGLLIAADSADSIDPEGLAAIAAAGLGLARRAAQVTGRGTLRRTVAYGSHGCAAFYAVGDTALMVVVGDEGMDLNRLNEHTRPALARIDSILTKPDRKPVTPPAPVPSAVLTAPAASPMLATKTGTV